MIFQSNVENFNILLLIYQFQSSSVVLYMFIFKCLDHLLPFFFDIFYTILFLCQGTETEQSILIQCFFVPSFQMALCVATYCRVTVLKPIFPRPEGKALRCDIMKTYNIMNITIEHFLKIKAANWRLLDSNVFQTAMLTLQLCDIAVTRPTFLTKTHCEKYILLHVQNIYLQTCKVQTKCYRNKTYIPCDSLLIYIFLFSKTLIKLTKSILRPLQGCNKIEKY